MKKHPHFINFLFQISTLTRLKRTGWQILGQGEESIAEHSYMVTMISYLLATELKADLQKTLLMALFHDTEEARTGDAYRLAKMYVSIDKKRAQEDLLSSIPEKKYISSLLEEYEKRESIESKIVKDADNLALCLVLKPLVERGDLHAKEWLDANLSSMTLPASQALAESLQHTDSQSWWEKERKHLHAKNRKNNNPLSLPNEGKG